MKSKLLYFLFLFTLVSSCLNVENINNSYTPSVSIPSPSYTLPSTLTQTKVVTQTPTLTERDMTRNSYSLTEFAQREATREAASRICGEGIKAQDAPIVVAEKWLVINCDGESGIKFVRIIQDDLSKIWDIPLDITNHPWAHRYTRPGLAPLYPFNTSPDGKYIFLRPYGCCIDYFSHYGYFVDAYGLYRLNLETGELVVLLMQHKEKLPEQAYSISISPDYQFLISVDLTNNPNIINVEDLETGEIKKIELSKRYDVIGTFVWTMDSNSLIFSAAFDGWLDEDDKAGITLYKLNFQTFDLVSLFYDDPRQFVPSYNYEIDSYWESENVLFLRSFADNIDYKFNVNKNSLIIIPTQTSLPTITPTP